MKRLLVTGGSGLLGSTVARRGAEQYEVTTTYLSREIDYAGVDCRQIDLTDEEQLAQLKQFDPDAVIHCAALTDVDQCEREPEVAETHNVGMSEHVARLAEETDARLIYISTDAVFDGEGRNYTVDDKPDPVNVYGWTKLKGEAAVQRIHEDSVVVRTSIYGWNVTCGESLAEWIISKFRDGESVPAFADAYFTPIYTGHLATYLFELIESNVGGILHIAGQDRCSKFDFAHAIADVFEFDADLIERTSIADVSSDAPRGKDLSLSVDRARDRLPCSLPTLREGLESMKYDRYE